MKILIVDDEKLTKEGLVNSIDWKALHIDHVYHASDGIQGLELAKKYHPELILSDIRMPRMDGITMAEEVQKLSPDTSIIFMSGYSDKQYLKAAIRLKAISYIEKPLDPLEVENAILEAIESNQQLMQIRRSKHLHSQTARTRLALQLTYPSNSENCRRLIEELELNIRPSEIFTTFIIKTLSSAEEIPVSALEHINQKLKRSLAAHSLQYIHAAKQNQYLIYHIHGEHRHTSSFLFKIGTFFQTELQPFCRFFIAIGKPQTGIGKVYNSYASAVVLLQSSFFHGYNSILMNTDQVSAPILDDPAPAFSEALSRKDKDVLDTLMDGIYQTFTNSNSLLPSQVKDIYYKLFMHLQNAYRQQRLSSDSHGFGSESILDHIEACPNLFSMHQLLGEKTNEFFNVSGSIPQESSSVFLIREFIHQNYMNDSLSVKTISEHVYLSSSYVCTIFKTETGQTLNQYITEYRITKAKQLLEDPRHKIADISHRVGYTDGNYFGKSFKKLVGLSPSEYREKILS